jgi:hypothetical protein
MKKTNQNDRFHVVKMNNYVKPNPHTLLTQTNKYVTNGVDNDYFYYVENRYLGSPTNQAIIDNFANYILGEGLIDESNSINLAEILDEEDARLAVTDFKMQGACVFQVVYTVAGPKKVAKLYYLPTKTVAINKQPDITDDIESYWYCFDWKNKTKFKPYTVPAFGFGEERESEILYIKRQSPQPLFALPDYQSGIQYAEVEEELSNYYANHIKNNFSAGKIINVNQGIPESDEAQEEAENAIMAKVRGTSNAGNIVISFNKNKENATTVENIEITDAYQQFEVLSREAREKIMLSHKVNDPALFGLPLPSGFSSAADQMVQSLKILYRSQINPSRKIFTKGLERALKLNSPNVKLAFVDFEELNVSKEVSSESNTTTLSQKENLLETRISFDFDGTLTTVQGMSKFREAQNSGLQVYIISARSDNSGLLQFADTYNVPHSQVYATGSNTNKVAKVKQLNITTHYDSNPDVISALPGVGKLI